MKQNILGRSPHTYKKQLSCRFALCSAALLLTGALNIIFTVLRTENNHLWMLLGNILTDILCGCFLVYYTNMKIVPPMKLYHLMERSSTAVQGVVRHIDSTAIRYMDLDCYPVAMDGRKLFLPKNTLTLETGRRYTLYLVSNIIVEVEL